MESAVVQCASRGEATNRLRSRGGYRPRFRRSLALERRAGLPYVPQTADVGLIVRIRIAMFIGTALVLASCGKPDASGIYVSSSDRNVTLVQIIETKDGNLTGRLEEVTVDANGTVKDETIPLDGAASDHDLLFKPVSAWYGGLQASGTFTDDSLTLAAWGHTLNVARSSLDNFQTAVTHLQLVAAGDRQRIADVRAVQARQAAEVQAIKDAAAKTATIEEFTARLRNDTARMDKGIADCPDFNQRSATNTARISKMLGVAPRLSGVQRGQLIVAANQIEVGTNQIEVARSQYAIELNQIAQDAGPIADQLERFCHSPKGAQFVEPCGPARAAVTEPSPFGHQKRDRMDCRRRGVANHCRYRRCRALLKFQLPRRRANDWLSQ